MFTTCAPLSKSLILSEPLFLCTMGVKAPSITGLLWGLHEMMLQKSSDQCLVHSECVANFSACGCLTTENVKGEIGTQVRRTGTNCSLWLSWILEIFQLILSLTNEKSKSCWVAKPGRSTGLLFSRVGQHISSWVPSRRVRRSRVESSAKRRMGCRWLLCECLGGLDVADVRAFFKLTFWLASSCSEPCFRKYLAINKGF